MADHHNNNTDCNTSTRKTVIDNVDNGQHRKEIKVLIAIMRAQGRPQLRTSTMGKTM